MSLDPDMLVTLFGFFQPNRSNLYYVSHSISCCEQLLTILLPQTCTAPCSDLINFTAEPARRALPVTASIVHLLTSLLARKTMCRVSLLC